MALKVEDIALLFYSNGQYVEGAADSCNRLQQGRLINEEHRLTDIGRDVLASTKRVLNESAKGVPFENRKWFGQPLKKTLFTYSDMKWYTASYMKKKIITNGHVLFVANSLPWMNAKELPKASTQIAKAIPLLWGRMKNLMPFFPHTYQIDPPEPFGLQLIWFTDAMQRSFVALSAVYFDAIQHKFPAATFWHELNNSREPLYVKADKQGVRGVVGVVSPVEVQRKAKPKMRPGWMEGSNAVQGGDVSVVQEEKRGAV